MICLHYIKVIGHLQLFVVYSFVAICVVCPVAIPEPFAHSRGIRLLETHSFRHDSYFAR